jgi:hypothetical protein
VVSQKQSQCEVCLEREEGGKMEILFKYFCETIKMQFFLSKLLVKLIL